MPPLQVRADILRICIKPVCERPPRNSDIGADSEMELHP